MPGVALGYVLLCCLHVALVPRGWPRENRGSDTDTNNQPETLPAVAVLCLR
jgi:hypothetical protein